MLTMNTFISTIFLISLFHVIKGQAPNNLEDSTPAKEPWDKETFKEEAAQTYNLVFHKYNHRVRPPVPSVEVDLVVTLAHIRHLDLRKQELQTVLNIEADWVDERLQWIPHKLSSIQSNTSNVWCPDIVYTNGLSPVKSLYPDMVRIISSGAVRWSRKEIVTTQCRTKPEEQTQHCSIQLGFLSNSRGDNNDRYFTNRSSVTALDGFGNHDWRLSDLDMNFDDNNDTKSATISIDLTLESKADRSTNKEQAEQGTKGRLLGSVENCTEAHYDVTVDQGNGARASSQSSTYLFLIISVVSLSQWLLSYFSCQDDRIYR